MKNIENIQQKSMEKLAALETDLDQVMQKFENRIKFLNPDIKDLAEKNFQEIIQAFWELKDKFKKRLFSVHPANLELVPEALSELDKLWQVVAEVLESNLEGFVGKSTINEKGEITSSLFSKIEKDENGKMKNKIEVGFNFVPTNNSQARFRIDHFNEQGRTCSLRIDRDEKYKGVFIDLSTPKIDKIFDRLTDENGNWHHFKSEVLNEFVVKEKFAKLVQVFKEIVSSVPRAEYFTLTDLVNKIRG